MCEYVCACMTDNSFVSSVLPDILSTITLFNCKWYPWEKQAICMVSVCVCVLAWVVYYLVMRWIGQCRCVLNGPIVHLQHLDWHASIYFTLSSSVSLTRCVSSLKGCLWFGCCLQILWTSLRFDGNDYGVANNRVITAAADCWLAALRTALKWASGSLALSWKSAHLKTF